MRKTGGNWYTVQYPDGSIVGNAGSFAAMVQKMIDEPEKYPTGGKVIEMKG